MLRVQEMFLMSLTAYLCPLTIHALAPIRTVQSRVLSQEGVLKKLSLAGLAKLSRLRYS